MSFIDISKRVIDKVFYSDILEMKDGEEALDRLNQIFFDFYCVVFDDVDKSYVVTVGKSYDDYRITLTPNDDGIQQHTFSLGGSGYYVETTYNEVNSIFTSLFRNDKLNKLGI